jgi:hypothetical protein
MMDQDLGLELDRHPLNLDRPLTSVDRSGVCPYPVGPFHLPIPKKIPKKGKETTQVVASLQ